MRTLPRVDRVLVVMRSWAACFQRARGVTADVTACARRNRQSEDVRGAMWSRAGSEEEAGLPLIEQGLLGLCCSAWLVAPGLGKGLWPWVDGVSVSEHT